LIKKRGGEGGGNDDDDDKNRSILPIPIPGQRIVYIYIRQIGCSFLGRVSFYIFILILSKLYSSIIKLWGRNRIL